MSEQEFNRIFAKNLRYQLDKNGMTQKELSEKLNVAVSSVGYWISASKTPRMEKLEKMCEIFHCKREDLMMQKDEEIRYIDSFMKRLMAAGDKLPNEILEQFVLAIEAAARACEKMEVK